MQVLESGQVASDDQVALLAVRLVELGHDLTTVGDYLELPVGRLSRFEPRLGREESEAVRRERESADRRVPFRPVPPRRIMIPVTGVTFHRKLSLSVDLSVIPTRYREYIVSGK